MASRAFFEPLKVLAFGSISAAYANVGPPTEHLTRGFCASNTSNVDFYVTTTTTQDEIFVAAGGFKLWDVQANINPHFDDKCVFPIGTQFQVRAPNGNPDSGNIIIEVLYAT